MPLARSEFSIHSLDLFATACRICEKSLVLHIISIYISALSTKKLARSVSSIYFFNNQSFLRAIILKVDTNLASLLLTNPAIVTVKQWCDPIDILKLHFFSKVCHFHLTIGKLQKCAKPHSL